MRIGVEQRTNQGNTGTQRRTKLRDSVSPWLILTFIFLLACITSACTTGNTDLPAKRVLFIGNSFTDYNGGVDQQLLRLAPNTVTSRISLGGFTLQDHWQTASTLDTISSGKWDVVVLQEQSQNSVTDYYNFYEYAQKLNLEIENSGAETILFMTWERPDSVQYGITTQKLYNAYTALGEQLGIKVAPVGLAFANALKERPDIKLYIDDGHPTSQGTYLAACVFYGLIYQESPAGNSYGADLSNEDKLFLQRIAAQTLGQ
ncbi:MAG: hypothetical protein HZB50_11785 [Chloroflexi bacterium]|nr:hypothetical protein [Chloroflexota bacterium]